MLAAVPALTSLTVSELMYSVRRFLGVLCQHGAHLGSSLRKLSFISYNFYDDTVGDALSLHAFAVLRTLKLCFSTRCVPMRLQDEQAMAEDIASIPHLRSLVLH